jgi:hypothetical protein
MPTVSAYESQKNKIAAAEAFHQKRFPQEIRNTAAVVLKNTISVFESLEGSNSAVAQNPTVGSQKNFIIKVASLAIPAMDVFDWVAVEPMATASTKVLCTRYVRMSNKGASKQGDIISDPFGIYYRENADGSRESVVDATYNGQNTYDEVAAQVSQNGTLTLRWTPVITGSVKINGDPIEDYGTINYATGEITASVEAIPAGAIITYKWDNKYLPAHDLPTFGAKVEAISLDAKPHKVRIVFDALDNLIYKNDYGIDISKELPKKAVEDFMYSVATEVSDSIVANAPTSVYTLPFSLAATAGWIAQHYASFGSVLNAAQAAITKVTKIYAGNRCFIGSALVPVVMAVPGWKSANTEGKIGTQLIGSIGNLKIYFKPDMDDYTYVVFAKGQGTDLCVGILGMYIAALPANIIPTQLLEFADGLNSQGFYSLYDYVPLNPMLSVKGSVTH